MRERRIVGRRLPEGGVGIRINGVAAAKVHDISSRGALVELSQPLTEEEEVHVQVELTDGELELLATVRHSRPAVDPDDVDPVPYLTGLHFDGLPAGAAAALDREVLVRTSSGRVAPGGFVFEN